MLILALTVAMLLIIWFKTNGVIEYLHVLKLTKLNKSLHIFAETLGDNPGLYVDHLSSYYQGFFIRLLTCPICTSIWLSIVLCSLFIVPLYSFAVAFLSLLFYSILSKLL